MAETVMKLLVMSDSHGDRAVVEEIASHYKGQVDAIFHNGDSELEAYDNIWQGIHVVGGNCDLDAAYPDHKVVEVKGLHISQTHGHLFGINFSWQRLDYWAQETNADLCLYGHLHVPAAEKRGKTLFVNPGSVRQPRGLIQEKLYALITVTEDDIRVEWHRLDHETYQEQVFSRGER